MWQILETVGRDLFDPHNPPPPPPSVSILNGVNTARYLKDEPRVSYFLKCVIIAMCCNSFYIIKLRHILSMQIFILLNLVKTLLVHETTLQTHHGFSTLKRRGNNRLHVVSTWNICGVFVVFWHQQLSFQMNRVRHWLQLL